MKQLFFTLVTVTFATLVGCTPELPLGTQVDRVPVLWNSSVIPMGLSKSVTMTFPDGTSEVAANIEFNCAAIAPVVTGWESGTYYVGDSYISSVLGNSITTTISQNGTDIIYAGVFDADADGGGYVLTYHTDGTFDFDQRVIWNYQNLKFYVVSIMSGTLTGNSYSGNGAAYCYQYEGTPNPPQSQLVGVTYSAHAISGYFGVLVDGLAGNFDDTLSEPIYGDTSWTATVDALVWDTLTDGNMMLVWNELGTWNASQTSGPSDPNWK